VFVPCVDLDTSWMRLSLGFVVWFWFEQQTVFTFRKAQCSVTPQLQSL
jgi:hypothetical protein